MFVNISRRVASSGIVYSASVLAEAYAKGVEDGRREAEPAPTKDPPPRTDLLDPGEIEKRLVSLSEAAAERQAHLGAMEESLRTIADCHRQIGQMRGRREGRREGLREGYQAGLLAAGFAALFHLLCSSQQEQTTRKLLLLLLWFGMVCTAGAFGYCCLLGPEEHHVGSVVKN